MSYSIGIVGLANAGKSTIFSALTAIQVACEAYPFCTIDPNHGTVAVPDPRLEKLEKLVKPEKVLPAVIEFVDIAGLVKGASQGEGLGNKFLSEIRGVDALAEVVRCFENADVAHPDGTIDPVRDIETVFFELVQKDLENVMARLDKAKHLAEVGDKNSRLEVELCEKMKKALEQLAPLSKLSFHPDEEPILREMRPLTLKKKFYVANLGEEAISKPSYPSFAKLREYGAQNGVKVVPFYGKLEAEVHELDKSEQGVFLKELGIEQPGLDDVINAGKEALGLITFYTFVGGKELRNWLVPAGTFAPQAAGKIHTDFEAGFIKADVISFKDFTKAGNEHEARKLGMVRVEGKEYVVQDGDIIHFKFKA
jgi:ribosome-binding ATPase